eukprot:TRINITY_DN1700_c5_g1_i1.p1 TRINITY_DN1700_c5_g1~~TRINITY_DN1700_c5_g1_i1.p1  ORF type:complete len:484 (-),score=97.60 TRINITY_DN1700_c5_g1_i1:25-1476(-)
MSYSRNINFHEKLGNIEGKCASNFEEIKEIKNDLRDISAICADIIKDKPNEEKFHNYEIKQLELEKKIELINKNQNDFEEIKNILNKYIEDGMDYFSQTNEFLKEQLLESKEEIKRLKSEREKTKNWEDYFNNRFDRLDMIVNEMNNNILQINPKSPMLKGNYGTSISDSVFTSKSNGPKKNIIKNKNNNNNNNQVSNFNHRSKYYKKYENTYGMIPLPNLNNTCYFNSSFQSLYNSEFFKEILPKSNSILSHIKENSSYESIKNILKIYFNSDFSAYPIGEKHDPLDAVNSIITSFDKKIQSENFISIKRSGSSLCYGCGSESTVKMGKYTRSINMRRILNTSDNVINGLIEGVPDKKFCKKCKKNTVHHSKYVFSKIPKILIISIFNTNRDGSYRIKEQDLCIQQNFVNDDNKEDVVFYKLISVISYNKDFEHAYSFVQKDDKLLKCSDDNIFRIYESLINYYNIDPYVLVYEQSNDELTN